jgi:3',5'-cyclic AMP phosphodiesterase CpdA
MLLLEMGCQTKCMRLVLVWMLFVAAAPAASFNFAIVSDRTGRAVPGVYEQAWREVAAVHPDFVITVGDAIEGLTTPGAARAEWEALKPLWLRDVPVYHAPGNHDIWDAASEALFTEETGRRPCYSFDFRGAHFVVLDNSRTEALSPAQMRFLESDLAKQTGSGLRFVVFHRPFWLIPLKLKANEFALQKVAKQYGVCCVISGHGHQLQSVTQDGVLYLEIGSSGASLAGAGRAGTGYNDGWFYQYSYVTIKDDGVTFEIRELSAPFGEGRKQQFHAKAR